MDKVWVISLRDPSPAVRRPIVQLHSPRRSESWCEGSGTKMRTKMRVKVHKPQLSSHRLGHSRFRRQQSQTNLAKFRLKRTCLPSSPDSTTSAPTPWLRKMRYPVREGDNDHRAMPRQQVRPQADESSSRPIPLGMGSHGQNGRPPKSELIISNWSCNLVGKHPLNWLSLRYSLRSKARLPISGGTSPINWLLPRYNTPSQARLPNSAGISPINWFCPMFSHPKLARLPNSGGISPLNWLLSSSSLRQVREVPQLRWYLAAQLVASRGTAVCKFVEGAQLRRNLSAQLVTR